MPVPACMRASTSRAYTPLASQNWRPLGFAEFSARATQGQKDIRVPVVSNQMPRGYADNVQGLQLRQFQSLLSRGFNISTAASIGQVYQPPAVMLATNKTGTGLGIGKLKNLNVNNVPTSNNLLAKATAFGRFANKIPVS